MANDFRLVLDNEQEVLLALRKLGRRTRDMRPAFTKFSKAFRSEVSAGFASEGVSLGKKWAPLSPRYAAWKLAKVGPKPILTFTGRLAKSLGGARSDIHQVGRSEATFGTSVEYATFHQTGTRRGLPKRPILVVTKTLRAEAARLVVDRVEGDF